MSHDITVRSDGIAEAVFALKPAWHGLGTVLDHPPTAAEAMVAAHLDWTVLQRQVAVGIPEKIDSPEGAVEVNRYYDIDGQLANVRSDNGFFLGFVTERYQVIQNTEAFGFMDSLLDSGEMTYESAFSLQGGKSVVLLGRLPTEDWITDNDKCLRYILFGLHHDGTGAIRFGPVQERVVCANTYAIALGEGNATDLKGCFSKDVAIRHVGDVRDKLNKARMLIQAANESFDRQAETCRMLVGKPMTDRQFMEYLDVLFPVPNRFDALWTPNRETAIRTNRDKIAAAFHNPRQSLPGIENTCWSAYNAVSEVVDHYPRRGKSEAKRAETRFNVTLAGIGMEMKLRAFETAIRFATVS